ncbi:aryl-sulfate sulfotransferase [Pelomonas sp. KK5]|uniref:aryl-sulfate sulfotransferase n=1 Tax=Pelomonas sp. KK5 TaxID=1855730 RepID=UPI001301B567|nr:aryl-sulfate sulfotransferase [Pelomonas sp. KK5]
MFSLLLAGCMGDDSPSDAEESRLSVGPAVAGASPFIQLVEFNGENLGRISYVNFTVQAKSGSVSKPVNVTQYRSYLERQGYLVSNSTTVKIPVFGLYSGGSNTVKFEVGFEDGSHLSFSKELTSPTYVDPAAIYDRLRVLKARVANDKIGFDFFALQSGSGTPAIYDTDGQLRWVGVPPVLNAAHSLFVNGGFVIGGSDGDVSMMLTRLELDGTSNSKLVVAPPYIGFHHNLDLGKTGYLGEFDARINGVDYIETILAELTDEGHVLTEWDFGKIIADFMTKNGDDPSKFVRPGVDWFHMNAALYDPQDDSVVASSRENFLIKVDYKTKEIVWIFGDPSKYWYTFPSLRSKALTLAPGGLYPIGQHGITISPDKKLLLFNNGYQSFQQPAGAPQGDSRNYSAVVAYTIDAAGKTATENWRFDYNKSIFADICSNPQQTPDGSILVNYASASGRTTSRQVGLNPQHQVVFDFELPTTLCQTSYHSTVVPLEALNLR